MKQNIYIIHKSDKLLSQYLYRQNKTQKEKEKESQLNKKILEFYQKAYNQQAKNITIDIFNYDLFDYGYKENAGYYAVYDGTFGYFDIIVFGDNVSRAFRNLGKNIIDRKSEDNINKNAKTIKKEYKNRFSHTNKYLKLYYLEYALRKWDQYYDGNIPQEILDEYLDDIDKITLSYDQSTKEIKVYKKINKKNKIS